MHHALCAMRYALCPMLFFRHLIRLLKEFFHFAWHNKAWWIIPVILVLLFFGFLLVTTQSALPFIYTLF